MREIRKVIKRHKERDFSSLALTAEGIFSVEM